MDQTLRLLFLKSRSKFIKCVEKLFYYKYKFTDKNEIDLSKIKKIALICTKPMGIGDLIMDTPFIKTLRENLPEVEIHLITDKDLFDIVKEIDKTYVLKKNYIKSFYNLKKENYDLGIVMNRSVNQSFYLEILNPKYKLGYLGGWEILANFELKSNEKFNIYDDHFWDMALKIAKSLGLKKIKEELIEMDFSKSIKKSVDLKMNELNLDKNKSNLFINPYASWKTRKWDANNYIKLIKEIHKDFNIILYGGKDAVKISEYIMKKCKDIKIYNLTGKFNLKEAVYALKFADLFFTPDTGPMHFAFLMRTPTLALFGPVNPEHRLPKNYKKFGIYDYIWINDYRPIDRFYDYEHEYINKDLEGLKDIPVEDVVNKIYRFFEKGKLFY